MTPRVLFNDLRREHEAYAPQVHKAVAAVLESGWYVLGEQVAAFEAEFARHTGTEFGIGVASGTEAIQLALTGLGVGRGDEVVTAPNTATPTVCGIVAAGATPVFADVREDTLNLDPGAVEAAVTPSTRAIAPVHLYGRVADLEALGAVAARHGLALVEDACQAHGASGAGSTGHAGCFSFYPTKNLGAYGDGGMIVTSDPELAGRLRLLRNYGQSDRYTHITAGINSRLDEVQAAILRIKLRDLDEANERRRSAAARYHRLLSGTGLGLPSEPRDSASHVHHLYVVRSGEREGLRSALDEAGIQTLIHYPTPVHLQPAFTHLGYSRGSFPVAERLAGEIVSLPMSSRLTPGEVEIVAEAVHSFLRERATLPAT